MGTIKELSECVKQGKWKEVIEMYEEKPRLHIARITNSGNTALHRAVSDGKEDVVKQMVDLMATMSSEERKEVLQTTNKENITALHIAASMGNVRICHIIASVEPSLVDDRNALGETPLFLAAAYGQKQAFLCLHYIRNRNRPFSPCYDNCISDNGDNILHYAIDGYYFDLAFQIIHLYKELANLVNKKGISPLYLLASKPDAFRSGSCLGRTETIIYHCIYVEKLKVAAHPTHELLTYPIEVKDGVRRAYPENYKTCWDVFRFMKAVVTAVVNKLGRKGDEDELEAVIAKDLEEVAKGSADLEGSRVTRAWANPLFQANYRTCCDLIKFFRLVLDTIILGIFLGTGSHQLNKLRRKKENHTWSVQVVEELLRYTSFDDASEPYVDDYDENLPRDVRSKIIDQRPSVEDDDEKLPYDFRKPSTSKIIDQRHSRIRRQETQIILVAARNGVMEIIERILELFPAAINAMNEEKMNIVLVAVQHRQSHVYEFLVKKKEVFTESIFRHVDEGGNSALHLAATLGRYRPSPSEAFHMEWDVKWYKFVEESMPIGFSHQFNKRAETPDVIFTQTHEDVRRRGDDWVQNALESGPVVATLVATVAFATAATVPGGFNQDSGETILVKETAFGVFAISSLIALCCSITAVVLFLSIQLGSPFPEKYLKYKSLLGKLLAGLLLLFLSIFAMLVSFCAGHFIVVKNLLQYAALLIYVAFCLPTSIFILKQSPLYFDLLWDIFKRTPRRSYQPSISLMNLNLRSGVKGNSE